MAQNKTEVQLSDTETSKEILKFLKDGEGEIEIGKFKNVTLLLGFTGSGKSTLTQFLTGNDEGLFASETGTDTGEYTILDKNHKICRGTIDSCTIIPALYTDKETKSGFYDCPGFGDTRSVKHDISVTYFIKKVIDSVDSVKLLFTVNHHSVMEGVDRQNFMLLVKNVVKMVKNIDKFKNSIALVVTKVDNKYIVKKRQFQLVPDTTVIANVANFLRNAKESLEAKMLNKSGDNSYAEAIKFIDILLEKNGDDYSRIALFRRPEEEGPLSGSSLLQSGKERMQKILQRLQYTPKTPEDFGYTVSAESLNQMHDLVDKVNEKLSKTFNSMGQAVIDHYTLMESESKDVEELSKTLTAGGEALSAIRDNRSYKRPILLSDELQKFARSASIAIPEENVADAAHYDSFLEFIREISGRSPASTEWLNGLKEAVETLGDKRQWVNLLVNLQTSLSDYNVVTEVRGSPEPLYALLDCIDGASSGSDGQCEALEDFLKQIYKNHLEREYANARKVKPNMHEWKLLKGLLDFSEEVTCVEHAKGSTLIMKGQYLKLSDVANRITRCPWSLKSVKIFASKKVFIDQSYSMVGKKVEVVIMAPNWEVVGSSKIILDGADGQDQLRKAPAGGGWTGSLNGRHGIAGGNGGEGGMFWGMGQNCVNCQRLTVSANGGRGGAGQDGGDGGDGRDFHTQYEGNQHGTLITVFYNKKVTDYIHYGEPGGNGGNGGDGGLGGPRGMAKFVMFGGGPVPGTSAAQGRPGTGGAGGKPGQGGRSERRIHRVQTVLVVPWWGDEVIDLGRASGGSRGTNGASSTSTYQATGRFSNPSQTLGDYRVLLWTKINSSLSDATTREFLKNLKNADIHDVNHHVGRRSVVHSKATDDNSTSNNTLSSITKAFTSVSTMTGIHHKFRGPSSDTAAISSNHPGNFQGINTKGLQTPNEISKIASSHSAAPALGDGFGVPQVQSTLLMLDYLTRMNNRARAERKKNVHANNYDSDYAHRMAYRAYVP